MSDNAEIIDRLDIIIDLLTALNNRFNKEMHRRATASEKKEFRKKYNLTQRDLARMVGVSQQAIWQFETGRTNPKITTLKVIASIIDQYEANCTDEKAEGGD